MVRNFSGTDQQLEAINSDAEVKRVLACAGSGKTWIITQSIIKILKDGLCAPNEILALTFTRNAAENMRNRIKEGLKLDIDFESIDIFTFNAFGNEIIKENSFELGLGKDFKLISSAQSWQIIFEIFDNFSFEKVKVGKSVGKFIEDLLLYIWNLKNNLVSVKDFEWYINNYQEILKDYKSKALRNDEERIAQYQRELLEIYLEYEKNKRNNNFIDYSDQTFLPYYLLLEKKSIREKYRQRYKYIFVDEFQDTNIAQAYLLSLIYNPGYNKLMIVGDDDQGIYSFRGACIENILDFHRWDVFKNRCVSDFYLTTNFRSGRNIVYTINKVIAANKRRFKKKLIPEDENKDSKIIFYSKKAHREEAGEISRIIKYLVAKDIKLKDMAILARRKRFKVVTEELEKNNIRYELVGGRSFFFEPEVLFIISWLRVIQNIYDEIYIIYLLKSPKYKICDRDIYFLKRYPQNVSSLNFTENNNSNNSGEYHYGQKRLAHNIHNIIEGLLHVDKNPYVGELTKKRISAFLDDLRFYISKSQALALKELVSLISDHSGLSSELRSRFGVEAKRKIKNVENLIRISSDFEQNSLDSSLESFITYLKDVAKSDYDDPDKIEMSSENSIKIMSIHAAKGLEFEVVFLPMLWENDFLGGKITGNKFEIPSELRKDAKVWKDKKNYTSQKKFRKALKDIKLEEERRIFYVACSRAKKILILSHSEYEEYEEGASSNRNTKKKIVVFAKDVIKNNHGLSVTSLEGLEFIRSNIDENFKGEVESYEHVFEFIDSKQKDRSFTGRGKHLGREDKDKTGRVISKESWNEIEEKLGRALDEINFDAISDKNFYKILKDLNPEVDIGSKINTGKNLVSNKLFFSLTHILTYLRCPALYRWKYLYTIPEIVSESSSLGEKVHRYIKYITMIKYRPDAELNLDKDRLLNEIDDRKAKKYVEVFLNSDLFNLYGINFIFLEQLFYWKLEDYYIMGRMDRMDVRKDGKIRIIDYKLSNYTQGKESLYYKNQLMSYAGAVSELFGKPVEDIDACLFFLKDNKKLELKFRPNEIEKIKTLILSAIENICSYNFDFKLQKSCKKNCQYYDLCIENYHGSHGA